MLSVNTNVGAMVALQTLNSTNADLAQTQNRVSTGLRVATAKDDGGTFAIAQNMRGDIGAYRAVTQSLGRLGSLVDVSLAAGTAVSDLLVQMKEKALSASDASTDATSRAALNNDFVALRDQIASIVTNANFNGVNMINAASVAQTAIVNTTGSAVVTVSNEVLSLAGANVTVTTTSTVDTITNAAATLALVNASITNVGNALARLGAGAKRLELQADFVSKIVDATTAGLGNLVDANMAQESAALQALQVKQQLGVQALSIANQAPQTILSLFR